MLRVLRFDEHHTITLRFEGTLDDESLPEFHRAVAAAKARQGSRSLFADVGDLRVGGISGSQALLQERAAGVHLFAARGELAELLETSDRTACEHRCGVLRRMAFALSAVCKGSPRALCARLHRRFHPAHDEVS